MAEEEDLNKEEELVLEVEVKEKPKKGSCSQRQSKRRCG